jgi:hypothetical protein
MKEEAWFNNFCLHGMQSSLPLPQWVACASQYYVTQRYSNIPAPSLVLCAPRVHPCTESTPVPSPPLCCVHTTHENYLKFTFHGP